MSKFSSPLSVVQLWNNDAGSGAARDDISSDRTSRGGTGRGGGTGGGGGRGNNRELASQGGQAEEEGGQSVQNDHRGPW